MRLGLLADIHEDVDRLAAAIARCRAEGADRLLTLGDVFEQGARFAEAVALLREGGVEGVWGNHEAGICHEPGEWVARAFDPATLATMRGLRPRMEVGEVLLGHVLPGHDPTDPEQPWYVEGPPDSAEAARPHFAASPHRRMFLGHYHRWYAATPDGPLAWAGEGPLAFDPGRRALAIVAAVCDGWCAVYDDEADMLTPCDLGATR